MKMSKSRILNYIQCPQRFYLDYIMDLRLYREEPEEGSPLRKGSELHKIFEDFYETKEAREIKQEERGYDYSQDILSILLQHPLAQKEDSELQAEYVSHLANFATWNSYEINKKGVDNYIPPGLELDLYDEELDFQGIIDRIEGNDETGYTIIDYKTGKPKTLKQYWLELVLYKMLFERTTNKKVARVGIYFSKTGKLRTTEDIDETDEAWALRIIDNIREFIEHESFPMKRTFLCRYCDHIGGACSTPLEFFG